MVLLRLKNINDKKKSNQHSTLVIGIGIVLTILILIIATIILTYRGEANFPIIEGRIEHRYFRLQS